jgi:hypothetical protein
MSALSALVQAADGVPLPFDDDEPRGLQLGDRGVVVTGPVGPPWPGVVGVDEHAHEGRARLVVVHELAVLGEDLVVELAVIAAHTGTSLVLKRCPQVRQALLR